MLQPTASIRTKQETYFITIPKYVYEPTLACATYLTFTCIK